MKISATKIKAFSFLMMALAVGAALIAGRLRESTIPFDIGDWSDIDCETAIAAYESEPTDEKLAELVHVLCWHYKVDGNEQVKERLLTYGEQLFAHAKAGTCDLEKLENAEGTLIKVLSVLREEGVS